MGRSAGMGAAARAPQPPKKKIDSQAAWREFRELLWVHRRRLAIGLTLMMISRLSGIVLPALSKYVIDDVIGRGRHELLVPIAMAAGAATIVQAITSFGLSQILGVADRVGSLENGKDATLFVCDGDPLDTPAQITAAWIRGRKVDLNDRQKTLYRKYEEKYQQP